MLPPALNLWARADEQPPKRRVLQLQVDVMNSLAVWEGLGLGEHHKEEEAKCADASSKRLLLSAFVPAPVAARLASPPFNAMPRAEGSSCREPEKLVLTQRVMVGEACWGADQRPNPRSRQRDLFTNGRHIRS